MGQFQDLKAQAAIIRDEQNSYQNTSLRVGRMFIDILEQLEKVLPDENVKPETLTVEATETSYKLKFSTLTSDGSVKNRELDLPIATDTQAGVMSPALMKGIKDQLSNLENETIPNNIANNNKISPFILINKYDMKEDGWYKTNGEVADSNSSFQRVDYSITEGAKYAYCRNVGQYSGFAICLMNGDTLLKSINSVNEIIIVDMSLYPTCTNIRISTQKSIAEGCFVLLDYVNDKKDIEKKVDELNENVNVQINSLIKSINQLENEIVGQSDESVEKSISLKLTSTSSAEFIDVLPKISHNYILEFIDGSEKIKPRSLTLILNNSIYYYEGNTDKKRILTWESDTKAYVTILEEDIPITGFMTSIGIVNQLQSGDVTIKVTNISENEGLQQLINSISEKVDKNTSNIELLDKRLDEIENDNVVIGFNSPSLHICDTIDCIVGDTIQLYYNMFVHHVGEYSLNIECHKGKNYPRYWEYTPTSSDVGITQMKIQLLNIDGSVIEEKTINIVTKNAVNPASPKNILLVGDSLYMSGQIAIELSRRLKGTTGIATSPSALSLSNFNVVGRLKNSDDTVGWEGTGGWSWSTYTKAGGMAGVRLTVSGITDVRLNQDCRYKMDEYTQNFYITEINVVDGTGYIFAAFYGQGDIYKDHGLMPQNGTLKRVTGEGQEEIIFTASQVESYQPFWNNETDSFDIKGYVDTYCDGHLEILCVQLGINSIIGSNPFSTDFESSVLTEAKKFIDLVHEQLPNAHIYIATLPLPSQNGGLGDNYSASSANGSYLTIAWNYKVHKVNDLYRSLTKDENYNQFVSVIDVCSEIDSDNNYPWKNKAVNTRSKSTEIIGTNGVHPSNEGYWQIADVWFRAII